MRNPPNADPCLANAYSFLNGFHTSIPLALSGPTYSVQEVIANTYFFFALLTVAIMTALEANQVESETEVPRLIGAFVACLVIAYLAVILRLISRRLNKTDLKADDWLLVTSLVSSMLLLKYPADKVLGQGLHHCVHRPESWADTRRPRKARKSHNECEGVCPGMIFAVISSPGSDLLSLISRVLISLTQHRE